MAALGLFSDVRTVAMICLRDCGKAVVPTNAKWLRTRTVVMVVMTECSSHHNGMKDDL